MASVAGVPVILMLLAGGTHLSLELEAKLTSQPETMLLFGKPGGEASFLFMSAKRRQSSFAAVLYRSTTDGHLLLKNTSQVSLSVGGDSLAFTLKDLSLSDSGDYVIRRWNRGTLKGEIKYSLIVCKKQCDINLEDNFSSWVLKTKEIGDRLQFYEKCLNFTKFPHLAQTTLVLDSELPPDVPMKSDQRGDVTMTNNSTTVRISKGLGDVYLYLLIWRGNQCCLSNYWVTIPAVTGASPPPSSTMTPTNILLKQGDRLIIPCPRFSEYVEEVIWETPGSNLCVDVSRNVSSTMSHQEGEEMYVETMNYSLVIPSVEQNHSGNYRCEVDYDDIHSDLEYRVLVCSDLGATHVRFSLGGAVDVVCGAELNVFWARGTFYRLEQELYSTTFNKQFFLTMSNLTLNDRGLYLCRIWDIEKGKTVCYEREIYLLLKHPFGIEPTFYRVYSSLMACGLLGMICAVICVHLRARGRDQTSQERLRGTAEPPGRPTREGEQSDPEYDDVHIAEGIDE